MSSPRATPTLLSHVQRGRMPTLAADAPCTDSRTQRPRPALNEVVFDVPLDLIVADSPIQTREPFDPDASDEDAALLDVVRQGLWTPPVVLRATDDRLGDQASTYQIEDGHRRVTAHRLAGRSTVRAVITRHDVREADLTTLRANTFKRLPPVQQAQAISRIRERHGLEYKTIAEMAGLTPRYVSELMRMLDAGEGAIRAVGEGRLSVHEAARIGRSTGPGPKDAEQENTVLAPAAEPPSTDSREPDVLAAVTANPPKTKPMSPGFEGATLQDDLNALGWLSSEQTAQLVAWARHDEVRTRQVLASALLLATDRSLPIQDAVGLSTEMLQGRVGGGIIQILETGLRLKRAVGAGHTSVQEREFIRAVVTWLLHVPGESSKYSGSVAP